MAQVILLQCNLESKNTFPHVSPGFFLVGNHQSRQKTPHRWSAMWCSGNESFICLQRLEIQSWENNLQSHHQQQILDISICPLQFRESFFFVALWVWAFDVS